MMKGNKKQKKTRNIPQSSGLYFPDVIVLVSQTRHAAHCLWEESHEVPRSQPLPIYLPLGALRRDWHAPGDCGLCRYHISRIGSSAFGTGTSRLSSGPLGACAARIGSGTLGTIASGSTDALGSVAPRAANSLDAVALYSSVQRHNHARSDDWWRFTWSDHWWRYARSNDRWSYAWPDHWRNNHARPNDRWSYTRSDDWRRYAWSNHRRHNS